MEDNFREAERTGLDAPLDQVEEAAARWLLKRESNQWSSADETQLADWLKSSANHRVAFIRLGSVWREASRLKAVGAPFAPGEVPLRGAIEQSPFFAMRRRAEPETVTPSATGLSEVKPRDAGRRWLRYGLAASCLLAACVAASVYFWPQSRPVYRTPIGGLATVPMADGSKVTLNTSTEITLAMTHKERRVNLVQGEAFFDVAKDPARPFVVQAGDQQVIAVGTRFSVRLKPEGIHVAVTEGQVRIEKRPLLAAEQPSANPSLLVAGTIADARNMEISIQQQPLVELERALSWREGYVSLRRASLAEAVAEFNRYNLRQLVIADPELAQIRVGGNFKSGNVDGFVRLLQKGFMIRVEEHEDRIVLTRRPESDE